jgi:hypothetical protein
MRSEENESKPTSYKKLIAIFMPSAQEKLVS